MKFNRMILLAVLMFSAVQMLAAQADFTVNFPDGWKKRDKSSALAHYMKGPGSVIITADVMPSEAKTPDAYIEFVKGMLSKTFKTIKYENVVKGTKDGLDTRELVYTVDMSGMKMKYDVLYVFKGGKAYTLTSANMLDLFDAAFAADVKSIFGSFKLK